MDSLAESTLTEHRAPGELAPVMVEESASKLILKLVSFRETYRANQPALDGLLQRYTFDGRVPQNQRDALSTTKTLCERLVHDQVDITSFGAVSPVHNLLIGILNRYEDWLAERNLLDFAELEAAFLDRLRDGSLNDWTNDIAAVLIDEYQDTNPLQEAIYFQIIASANPHVAVVGDDDQAMYRFRGGSVELFTQFGVRCLDATGKRTRRIDMIDNHRSSEEIVRFYNAHITGDPGFSAARILPPKPEVVSRRGIQGMPVIGMFRQSPGALAESLAEWLQQLLNNRNVVLTDGPNRYELHLPDEGDLGDFALLAHTVEEVKYNHFSAEAETRFAGYLRNAMAARGYQVFNPRGRSLRTIQAVQQLLGLILLCLDPNEERTNQVMPTNEARFFFRIWRNAATTLIAQNPEPSDNNGLGGFVREWQNASQEMPSPRFEADWPVLELIFKLLTWIPRFQDDSEHQVWLETIARTVSSAAIASRYGMQLLRDGVHRDRSRERVIGDALLPIAEDDVQVDEDIMPSVPRNRLQLMTIHQAKGLQFPFVIVDVGSQFIRNHSRQRFRRYPDRPSNVVVMEDDVENHLPTPLRGFRLPTDRTFDDLVRLYYVAYSRPQSVLMLIGCEQGLRYGREPGTAGAIPNIALGWRRDDTWPWRQPRTGRRSPIDIDPTPFLRV